MDAQRFRQLRPFCTAEETHNFSTEEIQVLMSLPLLVSQNVFATQAIFSIGPQTVLTGQYEKCLIDTCAHCSKVEVATAQHVQ